MNVISQQDEEVVTVDREPLPPSTLRGREPQ